jgi:hypothetical protein
MVMDGKVGMANGMQEQRVSKVGSLDGLGNLVQGDEIRLPRVGMGEGDAGS